MRLPVSGQTGRRIASEVTGYLTRQLATVAPILRGPTTRETFHVDIRT